MKIGYDECYNNSVASKYLAKARTNSLQVIELYGRTKENKENKYDTTCQLCKKEEEALEHFLIKCEKLEPRRDKELMEEIKHVQIKRKTSYLLYKTKKFELVSDMILNMWLFRMDLLKPP